MTPAPDADARRIALQLDTNVLVAAPAGSGKTGLLVTRALLALATVEVPEQVVAITFTRKAAAEIRNRMTTALQRAQAGERGEDEHEQCLLQAAHAVLERSDRLGWQLTEHPARLRMLTIDSFNSQLANQLPLASTLGGPTRISDDGKSLYHEAILRLFALLEEPRLDAAYKQAISSLLQLGDNRIDRLLEPLSQLLGRRDQWLQPVLNAADAATDDALLAELVTTHLRQLHAQLPVTLRRELVAVLHMGATQHDKLAWAAGLPADGPAATAANLAAWRKLAGLLITGTDGKGSLRKPRGMDVRQGFIARQEYTQRMQALLDELASQPAVAALVLACRTCQLLPEPGYPDSMRGQRDAIKRCLILLCGLLRTVFSERGETDFQEIALSAVTALRPEGGFGEALLAADQRIRHLLVDEMQDTSQSQIELLLQLTSGWDSGDGHSLLLVGDPQQSIYAFRNARIGLFLRLWEQQRLGKLPLQRLQLTANFRSDPALVDWFNASFSDIFPAAADAELGAASFTACHAMRQGTAGQVLCTRIDGSGAAANLAEGEAAADAAIKLVQAGAGNIALLAATRSQLAPALAALHHRGQSFAGQDMDALAGAPAVRDIIATARALWHPQDRLHWAILLRASFVGLCWADMAALSHGRTQLPWPERLALAQDCSALSEEGQRRIRRLTDALDAIAALPAVRGRLAERTRLLWQLLHGPACVAAEQLADVERALLLLEAHSSNGQLEDLPRFERALGNLYAGSLDAPIQALTIHKAKGLEYDHVLLVGCARLKRSDEQPLLHQYSNQGRELFVPRPQASEPADAPGPRLFSYVHAQHRAAAANEQLRLLYVAATRARKSLHLFYAAEYNDKAELTAAKGSFAALLQPHLQDETVVSLATPAASATAGTAYPPRAARLPLDYQPTASTAPVYRPREQRRLLPSAAVVSGSERRERHAEDNLRARLIGTLYHEAMQRIAHDWSNNRHERWADHGAARAPSLAASLRRNGLPEHQVGSTVTRILLLLQASLHSRHAQWILQPRPWAHCEFALGGYVDDRWVSAVLDRCFEEDGGIWVVDYKTQAEPLSGTALDAHLRQAQQQYRPQLQQYRQLLAELMPGKPVRVALYFPEPDRLLEIEPAQA